MRRLSPCPVFAHHTFERLVPKAKYYDTHPEYFSLVSGVRMKEVSQLCCTNEDVIRIVTDGVLKAFRENPQAKILSIGQIDFSFETSVDLELYHRFFALPSALPEPPHTER